jgi:hypothetical protein
MRGMWCRVVWLFRGTCFLHLQGQTVGLVLFVCLTLWPSECLIPGWGSQWHVTGDRLPHKFWVFENKNAWNVGSLLIFYVCFLPQFLQNHGSDYICPCNVQFAVNTQRGIQLSLPCCVWCIPFRLLCCVPGGSGRTIWPSARLKVSRWVKKLLLGVLFSQEICLQHGVA